MKITGCFLLNTFMRKITFSVLVLLMLAACSNPIDASEDDDETSRSSDTSLRTDPGDAVSTGTDSLHREDPASGWPKVNTVTGEIYEQTYRSGAGEGSGRAPGASAEPAQGKPGTK